MFAKKMVPLFVLFLFVSPIHAQTPGEADPAIKPPPPDSALLKQYTPLIHERIRFINKMYKLNMDTIGKLLQDWTVLVPAHDAYMKQHEPTLRLRTASLRIARKKQNISPEILARVIAKFENEIYQIHENAPLSLTQLVKMVEKDLSPEQVSNGRTALREQFADVLKDKQLMIDKLDRLAMGPIGMPDPEPTFEERERELKQRIKDEQKLAKSNQQPNTQTKKSPGQSPATPQKKQPPQPTTPPKPLPPAPAVAEWSRTLEATAAKYKFSEEQIKTAQRVLKSCVTRAENHLKNKKTDYEQAEKLTNADQKEKRIRTLNKTLDQLYNELSQRVESIASIEQKQGLVKTASQKDSKLQ